MNLFLQKFNFSLFPPVRLQYSQKMCESCTTHHQGTMVVLCDTVHLVPPPPHGPSLEGLRGPGTLLDTGRPPNDLPVRDDSQVGGPVPSFRICTGENKRETREGTDEVQEDTGSTTGFCTCYWGTTNRTDPSSGERRNVTSDCDRTTPRPSVTCLSILNGYGDGVKRGPLSSSVTPFLPGGRKPQKEILG